MYAAHFGLRTEAFSLTPDPAFLYRSPGHAEALAAIKVGLQGRRGLMLMTGEVGTGKTTLLYSLLSELGPEIRTAYISNTMLSLDEILRQALVDFQAPCISRDRLELLTSLNAFLQRCAIEGVTAALVIDEAQNLDEEAFENIRLLSNFETFTSKLLQIVLVGQPELDTKLRRASMRQVAERIAVRCHVNPLSRAESRKYIAHRLQCAGGSPDVFTPAALRLVVRKSQGIPRRMNIVCHNALLFAYGRNAAHVTAAVVRSAVREHEGRGLIRLVPRPSNLTTTERPPSPHRWLAPLLGVASVAVAAVVVGSQWGALQPSGNVGAGGGTDEPAVAVVQPPARRMADSAPAGLVAVDEPMAVHVGTTETEIAIAPVQAEDPAPATSPARLEAPAVGSATVTSAAAAHDGVRMVHVTPGRTLASLLREVYGDVNPELLNQVQRANPQVVDPNHILAGDTLRFPELAAVSPSLERSQHE